MGLTTAAIGLGAGALVVSLVLTSRRRKAREAEQVRQRAAAAADRARFLEGPPVLPERLASIIDPFVASVRAGQVRPRLMIWARNGLGAPEVTAEGADLLELLSKAGWEQTSTSYQVVNRDTGTKRHITDEGFISARFTPMEQADVKALAEVVDRALAPLGLLSNCAPD